ncbi:hypothetical protein BDZ90DRAFT_247029 [Jaminaea rosea]|uniref:BZIP domain-containing protein n=1 Tax=Jaminaea rosea TaxID=1569628 RepID=A0A316ULE9_9BASI|nr:hypothetical protein BDZ90DRAFT_247029 [Jaminaea rosea]PWN25628.1 hypothetical protein BDZ90DRAFT_247029 [Jaminaea rosea]
MDDTTSFLGWDNHRSSSATGAAAGGDDLFSSPLWTDPSPALTDHNTFDVESCGPSPLLTDDLDRPAPDLANMPLFGDMTLFSPAVRGDHQAPHAPAAMGQDFPLFPEVMARSAPGPTLATSSPPPPRAQMAFSATSAQGDEDQATMLLRALQGVAAARQSNAPVNSASPTLISSPPKELHHEMSDSVPQSAPAKPTLHHSATAPQLDVRSTAPATPLIDPRPTCPRRGTKRRMGVDDLLPIDAPVQERNYLAPSATSRKDFFEPSTSGAGVDNGPTADELAAIAAEPDPLKAKRLSNTLAARRSRHRKAAEAAEREGKIAELEQELAAYKRRLQRAEGERDALLEEKEEWGKKRRCSCAKAADEEEEQ